MTPLKVFLRQLEHQLSLLIVDYDGTLAPFHVDPSKATPYPGVEERLEALAELGQTTVVIVSGREIASLKNVLHLKRWPELWGQHGGERETSKGTYSLLRLSPLQKKGIQSALEAIGPRFRTQCEKKSLTIALHWRGLDEETQHHFETDVQDQWRRIASTHDLEILPFNQGLEIRPKGLNKGLAVTEIMRAHPNCVTAYVGDDLTDEDAFKVVGRRGAKILVGDASERETLADYQLQGPQQLLSFLDDWGFHVRTLKEAL